MFRCQVFTAQGENYEVLYSEDKDLYRLSKNTAFLFPGGQGLNMLMEYGHERVKNSYHEVNEYVTCKVGPIIVFKIENKQFADVSVDDALDFLRDWNILLREHVS